MNENSADITLKNNEIPLSRGTVKTRPDPLILRMLQKFFEIAGPVSPGLTGRLAYNLWLTPTRFKTPVSEQATLRSAAVEFHRINSKNIATFSWGGSESDSRPSILLVHGWSGRGTQMGPFVEPLIDAGYRVISFDAPAHGKSSGKQTTLYEISDTVLAMQEIFGEFEAVITHSFGGPCTALAITHGLKINRFVCIAPPATTLGLIDKFSEALHLTSKTTANLVDRMATAFGSHIWEALSMKNKVKEIDVPGLVIHDAHDTDVSWEEGQVVAYAWNNAPLIITSGLGHRRILRDNGVIESAIKFIKG